MSDPTRSLVKRILDAPAIRERDDREFPGLLAIDSWQDVPPGAQMSLQVLPRTLFLTTRFAIPRELAPHFALKDARVGVNSQFATADEIPCDVFASDVPVEFLLDVAKKAGIPEEVPHDFIYLLSDGPHMELDACQVGRYITFIVCNKSLQPARFVAGIAGRAYREKRMS